MLGGALAVMLGAAGRGSVAAGQIKDGIPTDDAVPAGFTSPEAHGALGDGVADDTSELNTAFGGSAPVWVRNATYKITNTVTIGSNGGSQWWGGRLLYAGAQDRVALTNSTNIDKKVHERIRVVSNSQSNWSNDSYIGVHVGDARTCLIDLREVAGFTIGVRCRGVATYNSYTVMRFGRIRNCEVGFDNDSLAGATWCNENLYFGGLIEVQGGVNDAQDRIGIRSWSSNEGYDVQNHHDWYGFVFDLGQGLAGLSQAWWTSGWYHGMYACSRRSADQVAHFKEQATANTGRAHSMGFTYTPAKLVAGDVSFDSVGGNLYNILPALQNLLDGAAANNIEDAGGVIS